MSSYVRIGATPIHGIQRGRDDAAIENGGTVVMERHLGTMLREVAKLTIDTTANIGRGRSLRSVVRRIAGTPRVARHDRGGRRDRAIERA
jgi:hypothetical protein